MAIKLVTGGAGFIGSHIVEALVARGDEVRVIDDLSTGSQANLEGLPVDLRVGEVGDAALLEAALEGVDTVFHEAALVSVPGSFDDPVRCYEVNLQGSLALLEAARRAGVRRVVLASSAAVYGEVDGPVDEGAKTSPLSPYAASKLAMEGAARLYNRMGLPTVCLRYFNVFGPRQSPDSPYAAAIPIFIENLLNGEPPTIYGDGLQSRDFVFVEDVVRANLLAAESESAPGGAFNISGDSSITILELVDILQRILGTNLQPAHAPERPGDIRHSRAVIERAEQALGYRPEIDVEAGLRRTVKWFQAHRQ